MSSAHTHCPHCERPYGPRSDAWYRRRHEAGCGSAGTIAGLVEAMRDRGLTP